MKIFRDFSTSSRKDFRRVKYFHTFFIFSSRRWDIYLKCDLKPMPFQHRKNAPWIVWRFFKITQSLWVVCLMFWIFFNWIKSHHLIASARSPLSHVALVQYHFPTRLMINFLFQDLQQLSSSLPWEIFLHSSNCNDCNLMQIASVEQVIDKLLIFTFKQINVEWKLERR